MIFYSHYFDKMGSSGTMQQRLRLTIARPPHDPVPITGKDVLGL